MTLPTRPLGPDAHRVSGVGFGGMPLSIRDRPLEGRAIDVLHAALDAGMTLIDTADVYCIDDGDLGHNERLIAKALRSWAGDRDRIVVATKGGLARPRGHWVRDGRPEHLHVACRCSLKALGVERIDLYQLHAPDPDVPFADSVGALAELRAEGLIRWVGLSNVSVAEIEEARRIVEITTVQNRLNPFFREAVDEGVVAHCDASRIGFLAYSPVGGGRLHKKLPGHPALVPIAARHGATPHQVVLAWVAAQGESVIPIPGARQPETARASADAAHLALSGEDLDAVTAAEFSRT